MIEGGSFDCPKCGMNIARDALDQIEIIMLVEFEASSEQKRSAKEVEYEVIGDTKRENQRKEDKDVGIVNDEGGGRAASINNLDC